MIRKIVQPFFTAYVVITFSVSVAIVFPFIALLSLLKTTPSQRAIFTIVRYWAKTWLRLIGMSVTASGNYDRAKTYVIIANHISYLDTIVIFSAIPQYFRPLGKKEISGIPVIGMIYKQLVTMVDRDSAKSRARSLRLLWHVLGNDSSILIFPEGTFNETGQPLKDFYDGAFRLAINTQTPLLPVLFPDTVSRWHYSAWWKLWPGRNRAVFLPLVEVAGLATTDLTTLKSKVFTLMENGIIGLQKE